MVVYENKYKKYTIFQTTFVVVYIYSMDKWQKESEGEEE